MDDVELLYGEFRLLRSKHYPPSILISETICDNHSGSVARSMTLRGMEIRKKDNMAVEIREDHIIAKRDPLGNKKLTNGSTACPPYWEPGIYVLDTENSDIDTLYFDLQDK